MTKQTEKISQDISDPIHTSTISLQHNIVLVCSHVQYVAGSKLKWEAIGD